MDSLLGIMGTGRRLDVLQALLSTQSAGAGPTHAELRKTLGISGPALTQEMRPLKDAGIVTTADGPRRDQPVYVLRKANAVHEILVLAAQLDATLTRESALLLHAEAEMKQDRLRNLEELRPKRSAGPGSDDPR